MMHPDVVGRIVSFIVVSFALLASSCRATERQRTVV